MDQNKKEPGQQDRNKDKQPVFDRDQPKRQPGQPDDLSRADDRGRLGEDAPLPSFDEGERKPSPIESTGYDGVRGVIPGEKATKKGHAIEENTADATMPPGEGQNPKRNTM